MRVILFIWIGLSVGVWAGLSRSGTGIVTDSVTQLQWQDDYSDNGGQIQQLDWKGAIEYCEALDLGGYSDWRLPNKNELLSIVDYTKANPAISSAFQNTASSDYWTSTTNENSTSTAWDISFFNSRLVHGYKFNSSYIRCVRGN